MKRYYATDKSGDWVEVDKSTAAELVRLGKKQPGDFQIHDDGQPLTAPLTSTAANRPARESTYVNLDAVSGAGKYVAPEDKGPGPVRRAAQKAYRTAQDVTSEVLSPLLAVPFVGLNRIGGGKQTYVEAREEAAQAMKEDPLGQLISDPLNFVPMGLLSQGAKVLGKVGVGGKGLEAATAASKMSRLPSRTADAVAEGVEAGRRLNLGRKAAAPMLAEEARLAARPKNPYELVAPYSDYTSYAKRKQLAKLKSAERDVAELGAVGRGVAKLPEWLQTGVQAGAAPLHGALQGAGYGAATTALSTDEDLGEIGKSALYGGIGGGLLGTLGHALREKGIAQNPAVNPSVTNKFLTDDARRMIRSTLPEVYDPGFLPMRRATLAGKSERELDKLSQGPYRSAAATLHGTNVEDVRKLKITPEELPEDLMNSMYMTLDATRAKSKRPGADLFSGSGEYTPLSRGERARLQHAIDTWVDRNLAEHPNAEKLKLKLQNDLAKAGTFDEFTMPAFTVSESTLDTWLNSPRYAVPVKDLRQGLQSRLEGLAKDPQAADFYGLPGADVGDLKLPGAVQSRAERKIDALLPMQRDLDVETLSQRYMAERPELSEAEARALARGALTQHPTEVDPLMLADYRTSSTSPATYKDNSSAEVQAARAAVDREFRDVVNEKLEEFAPYAEALGPKTRQEYAKWKAWSTLAQHPGSVGLQHRVLGMALDPLTYSASLYKGGNLLQRLIPYLAQAQSDVRLGYKPKSDTAKTKKEK